MKVSIILSDFFFNSACNRSFSFMIAIISWIIIFLENFWSYSSQYSVNLERMLSCYVLNLIFAMNFKAYLTQVFFCSLVNKHTHGHLNPAPQISLAILNFLLLEGSSSQTRNWWNSLEKDISDLILLITSFNLKKVYD